MLMFRWKFTIIKCIDFILVHTSIGEKWHKRHLTYRIMNWPRSLSPSQVHLAVDTAFQLWSNVSGLLFQELQQGPTDIRLAFFEGEHNDGMGNAFDGPGEFLLSSFLLNKLNWMSCLKVKVIIPCYFNLMSMDSICAMLLHKEMGKVFTVNVLLNINH